MGDSLRVLDVLQVDGALIGEVVEHIGGRLCSLAALLGAKYQVYPFVQVLAHVVALQRLPLQAHELVRAALCPGGQLNVTQGAPILQADIGVSYCSYLGQLPLTD